MKIALVMFGIISKERGYENEIAHFHSFFYLTNHY